MLVAAAAAAVGGGDVPGNGGVERPLRTPTEGKQASIGEGPGTPPVSVNFNESFFFFSRQPALTCSHSLPQRNATRHVPTFRCRCDETASAFPYPPPRRFRTHTLLGPPLCPLSGVLSGRLAWLGALSVSFFWLCKAAALSSSVVLLWYEHPASWAVGLLAAVDSGSLERVGDVSVP